MQLRRRKTKGMSHSLFKSSMGGKESRRHAKWRSPIYSDSSAIPAGVTLVPNQPVLAAVGFLGPTGPGFISRLWLTACMEERSV